jgi:hypothetical protein
MELNLRWVRCQYPDGIRDWCALASVDLAKVTAAGVYVVWYAGNPGRYLRVGQGLIAERLAAQRLDDEVTAYAMLGPLRVSWAVVPQADRDGVERFLADNCRPLIADFHPRVLPIAVNLPAL